MVSRKKLVSQGLVLLISLRPSAVLAAEPLSSIEVSAPKTSFMSLNQQVNSPPLGVSPRPGNNAAGDLTLGDVPAQTSPPPRLGLFPQIGAELLANGVEFHGVAFNHFLANPSAGSRPGNISNLGAFRPAVDLDLQKIAGIPGGTLRAAATMFSLRSDIPQIITQTGGFLTGFQTTPATETYILSVLTYEQRLFDDHLSIEFGRTNAYNYFLLPNSLDAFTHFSSTFEINGDFPSTPYPVWGGRATYKFDSLWYLQGGIFEDDYRNAVKTPNHFSIDKASGVQFIGEVGYRSDFNNSAYPSNLEAGFMYDRRSGVTNVRGTGANYSPFLAATNYPSAGVFFAQGQQVLWRGEARDVGPPKNFAVYGSLDVGLSQPQPVDFDVMVGANFTGLIPNRPFDADGFQVRYQRLSQIEADHETLIQRRLIGPGPAQSRNGLAFEAVANIKVAQGIFFKPFVQYFVTPDNYYPPASPPGRPKSGFEVGFTAVIPLGQFLGTSLKPF